MVLVPRLPPQGPGDEEENGKVSCPCWHYMGAAIFDHHRTCQHRALGLVELQPKANDLCTRLAGAAKQVPKGKRKGGRETPGWDRGGSLEA